MIFLDTSFFVAYYNRNDANHGKAKGIATEIEGETLVLSSHNVEETATFFQNREGGKKAREIAMQLMQSREMEIIFPDREKIIEAIGVMGKNDGLSLCDSLAVCIMHEKRIRKIASFDADFDRFPGIVRLH
ncbi:MAG: PIN domain-containing protein [Candidatus Micrarchaeota archaeon]